MQSTLSTKRPATSLQEDSRPIPPAERDRMIAEAAYYRAQKRNFEAGYEVEDWLAAGQEIEALAEAAT